ncbi:MAG: hypothetical protein U0T82_05645 [Bacteroidales bacterium]
MHFRRTIIILAVCLTATFHSPAQARLECLTGVGYLEHFITGAGIKFKNGSSVTFRYGSNFFVNPHSFSSFSLQYERNLNRPHIEPFHLNYGLRGGYAIYSNTYYRWKLVFLVPFAGLNYQLNEKLILGLQAGFSVNRELSAERLEWGEIGWYREYLPEFNVSLSYAIF